MSDTNSDDDQGLAGATGRDPVTELQAKLSELSNKHDQAMARITALSDGASRSYVYLSNPLVRMQP